MRSKTAIGEQIYHSRRRLGWTQGALAGKVGVSKAAISQFELGDSTPSAETQAKLSQALGEELVLVWHDANPDNSGIEHASVKFIPINMYEYLSYLAQETQVRGEALAELDERVQYTTVVKYSDVDYDFGYILEIKHNSMAPRYPHGARYYIKEAPFASDDEIRFMSGVYLFILDEREPFVRRVVSTAGGRLTLQADATRETLDFEIADLKQRVAKGTCWIFKLDHAVYMPAE